MSEWIKRLAAKYAEVNEKKKLDPVDQDELKGSHADRKDKDIDNDGDVDKSDEYLHNRRKAVSKAMKKEGDEEVIMNPKKEKKEKSTETDSMAQEGTLPPVYARIVEARGTADKDGKHYKKAADQEDWNEKEKNNKGAMDMKKDHEGPTVDNPEADDQMTKAANAAPKAAARKGDNAAGDKKIIPSATPTKGM